jgi:hypothetical protein
MGRNPFEDDPDVQAMRSSMRPSGGPVRWGRIATGVALVGCLAFGFGYHLPLQRAHASLNQHFAELQTQLEKADRAADEARKQTKALEEKQQTLESEAASAKQAEKARLEASQAIKSALDAKVQKLAAKDQAAVGVMGGSAVVSLALGQVLTAGKLEVSAPGKVTLCSVAAAAGSRSVRVTVVADKKSIAPALAAKLKTPLQHNLAAAQAVAEALIDKCSIAPERLNAGGAGGEPAAPGKLDGKRLAGPRVELWLE